MKVIINISLAVLLLSFEVAQAACLNNSISPCESITVNTDATAVSCRLNRFTSSSTVACMVDLNDVKNQINSDSTVQGKNITITDTTPMVIQAWGGNGASSIGSIGNNVGGAGGYAQTVTSINNYNLDNFSTQFFFYLGAPGHSANGSEQSHCGAGGGASTVVSTLDLSLSPDTRPVLAEAILVAGGGGGAGDMNFSGFCNFGTSARGGPGAAGGVAIATTEQAVNAAGGTNLSTDGNCTSNGGGDWNGSGGGGSGGGGASGASGIGSWGGNGGKGSSCTPGTTAIWFNTSTVFPASAVDSGGGGNSDTNSCTSGGGGGGGGYGGGSGGRHGNDDQNSCGGGGGGSYAVIAAFSGGPKTKPGNPFGSNGGVALQFLINTENAPVSITQNMNMDSFQKGETLKVGIFVSNFLLPSDFFIGAIAPDGKTIFFVTALQPLTLQVGSLDNPKTFKPLTNREAIPNGVNASLPAFISHTFVGTEPEGNYQFFSALTQPNAFANGSMDNGDFISLDIDPFSYRGKND